MANSLEKIPFKPQQLATGLEDGPGQKNHQKL